jgi:hypothetical protein
MIRISAAQYHTNFPADQIKKIQSDQCQGFGSEHGHFSFNRFFRKSRPRRIKSCICSICNGFAMYV